MGAETSEGLSSIAQAITTLTDAPADAVWTTAQATKNLLNGQPYIYDDLKDGFTFNDVITWIDTHYDFTYIPFSVGALENTDTSKTTGSCKVLAYAKLVWPKLSQVGALDLFAEHFTNVKETPEGTNHPNIRALMKCGIDGVVFHWENPLKLKK